MDIFALFVFRKMYIVEPRAKVDYLDGNVILGLVLPGLHVSVFKGYY